jgi:hypothetical protein
MEEMKAQPRHSQPDLTQYCDGRESSCTDGGKFVDTGKRRRRILFHRRAKKFLY